MMTAPATIPPIWLLPNSECDRELVRLLADPVGVFVVDVETMKGEDVEVEDESGEKTGLSATLLKEGV
jgi:hypothetical protein